MASVVPLLELECIGVKVTEPRIFSPFERVATEIAGFLQRKKFKFSALTFRFDDLDSTYTYINNPDWENQGWNIDPEKSLYERLLPEFSGSFTVVTEVGDDGQMITRRFRVFNCLRVSEPYAEAPEEKLNTRVGSRRYRAVESTDTLSQRQSETFQVDPKFDVAYDARPFDQYTLLAKQVDDEEYVLLGPSCNSPKSYLIGVQRYEGHDYEISIDDWAFERFGFKLQDTSTSESTTPSIGFKIILRYGVMSEPWFPGSSFSCFNGSHWQGGDLLALIRVVMLMEMNKRSEVFELSNVPGYNAEEDTLYVDVDIVSGVCYLPMSLLEFSRKYARVNSKVDDYLSRFSATEDTFTLSSLSGETSLIGSSERPNLSFVWSFAHMLGKGSPSDTIVALKACLDRDLFRVEKGRLVGRTSEVLSQPYDLSYDDISGGKTYRLQRVSVAEKFDKLEDGLLLLGYDDAAGDDKDNNPTHWIVAKKEKGEFFNVYDPFNMDGAGLKRLSVTNLLNMQDAQVIVLKGDESWSWTNS